MPYTISTALQCLRAHRAHLLNPRPLMRGPEQTWLEQARTELSPYVLLHSVVWRRKASDPQFQTLTGSL